MVNVGGNGQCCLGLSIPGANCDGQCCGRLSMLLTIGPRGQYKDTSVAIILMVGN